MSELHPAAGRPIGIVVDSMHGGGAERVALLVAEGLAAAGHRVDLFLFVSTGHYLPLIRNYARVCTGARYWSSRGKKLRRALHRSVRIAHFGPRWSPRWLSWLRVAARLFGIVAPALVNRKQAHEALALADYIDRERPRALFAFLQNSEIVALLGNKLARNKNRVAVTLHAPMRFRNPSARGVAKAVFPFADGFIAVSEDLADDLARSFNIARGKIKRCLTLWRLMLAPAILRGRTTICIHGLRIFRAALFWPREDFPNRKNFPLCCVHLPGLWTKNCA